MAVSTLLAAALLSSALVVDAQWASSATTQVDRQIIEPNPIACECSDANPRDGVYYNVTYTCLQQLVYGSCNEHFITDSVKELSEGYCQVTCGRCSCCKTVSDTLQSNNANTLLKAAQLAGLDKQLASPASMFTLLAPTDAAFTNALPDLGGGSLESVPVLELAALLSYHIIPPHPGIDAVWTTPFFKASKGAEIDTAIPDAPLTFEDTAGTLKVTGASNSARFVTSDIEACKSFINVIDAVLLPPNGSQAAPLSNSAGNIAANFAPAPVQVEG